MKKLAFILGVAVTLFVVVYGATNKEKDMTNINPNLSKDEERIIVYKGTEMPFTGKYYDHKGDGIYTCKNCGKALFDSHTKFESGSGWPSFDDSIKGAIKEIADKDGRRTEIVCANCGAHLGHVFRGEGFTKKNTRHCVNSASLGFDDKKATHQNIQTAYFAGGCFWGVEYHFEKLKGVIDASSGYMGGHTKNPSYQEVCYTNTGHLEVVKVKYDANEVSFETLTKLFFEIHDPTQKNGQGPDIGAQYLSAIFYQNEEEKQTAQKLITMLQSKGYNVATKLIDSAQHEFFKAEEYHQDYYTKHNKAPYCHNYVKRF